MAKKHENFGRLDDGLNVEIAGFIDEIAKSKQPPSPLKKGEGGHFSRDQCSFVHTGDIY